MMSCLHGWGGCDGRQKEDGIVEAGGRQAGGQVVGQLSWWWQNRVDEVGEGEC
jgi:hypothetical protein